VASSDLAKSPTRSANRRGLPAIVHTATLVRNGKFFVKKIMAVDKDGWIDYEFNSPAAPPVSAQQVASQRGHSRGMFRSKT